MTSIWCIQTNGRLPLTGNERLTRYGLILPELAKRGHDVTWFASSFHHQTKQQAPANRRSFDYQGVSVRAVDAPSYPANTSPRRIWHNNRFAKNLFREAKGLEPPDVILTSNPAPENLRASVRLAKRHDAALIVDIRDDWPDDLLTVLPEGFARTVGRQAARPYFRWTRDALNRADVVVASSASQLGYGQSLVSEKFDQPSVIYHPYAHAELDPAEETEALDSLRAAGVDFNKKLVVFAGTTGIHIALEAPIRAMSSLAGQDVQLVVAGDGHSRRGLIDLAASDAPPGSCVFLGWIDHRHLTALLSRSHIGLAPYQGINGIGNKVGEYLGNGLPILIAAGSEGAELVQTASAGLPYDIYSEAEFVDAVQAQLTPATIALTPTNTARLFNENFSIESATDAFEHVIERAANRRISSA